MPLRLRRTLALTIDLLALGAILVAVSFYLPEGPPPVDAMALFSAQDFRNYFTLVALCFALSALRVIPWPGSTRTFSLGDTLLRLRLLQLDGSPLNRAARIRRWTYGLSPLTLVLVPGPLISILIGASVAHWTNNVFLTPADALDRAGYPGWLVYTLHGLSFAALGAAVMYLLLIPAIDLIRDPRKDDYQTPLDRRSGTTHFGDA
jgi:hypothetical protein